MIKIRDLFIVAIVVIIVFAAYLLYRRFQLIKLIRLKRHMLDKKYYSRNKKYLRDVQGLSRKQINYIYNGPQYDMLLNTIKVLVDSVFKPGNHHGEPLLRYYLNQLDAREAAYHQSK